MQRRNQKVVERAPAPYLDAAGRAALCESALRLMRSDFREPVNVGSDEMVSINELAHMIAGVAGKKVRLRHVSGPLGVAGRNSDNRLIEKVLGWRPTAKLRDGIAKTYPWIAEQVRASAAGRAGV